MLECESKGFGKLANSVLYFQPPDETRNQCTNFLETHHWWPLHSFHSLPLTIKKLQAVNSNTNAIQCTILKSVCYGTRICNINKLGLLTNYNIMRVKLSLMSQGVASRYLLLNCGFSESHWTFYIVILSEGTLLLVSILNITQLPIFLLNFIQLVICQDLYSTLLHNKTQDLYILSAQPGSTYESCIKNLTSTSIIPRHSGIETSCGISQSPGIQQDTTDSLNKHATFIPHYILTGKKFQMK
jgi:hypothetical protein